MAENQKVPADSDSSEFYMFSITEKFRRVLALLGKLRRVNFSPPGFSRMPSLGIRIRWFRERSLILYSIIGGKTKDS